MANQVSLQSQDYGIRTEVFVGSKREYDSEKLSDYQSGDIIAISTYSGLFNISPGIKDPNTIILDDAHGAESYIGSMWSIDINRRKDPELYRNIFSTFEKDLPTRFCDNINSGNRDRITHRVEKVPYGSFYRSLEVVRDILDSVIIDENPDVYFSWQAIGDGLQACHVYISFENILIRPYIPPTLTHEPFENADQRVYMSATLGRGGELERITGIENIEKIPTPKTYESRGIGRRLYLFPDYSLSPMQYEDWLVKRISESERTLILCPSYYRLSTYQQLISNCSPSPLVLSASDIEETMNPFKEAKHSVLMLANRYDGIDLPDGICRQVIINGLPSGTNLQEAFLDERLGLDVLLRERIKTRIQQASGRCTRSHRDRVSIIMTDRKLLGFCQKAENQKIIHPELRAEIRFGLRQTTDDLSKFNAIISSFEANDENWKNAEKVIDKLRASDESMDTSITNLLEKSVNYEVNYSYALWSGDYRRAVDMAMRVSDNLSHRNLGPYRALWTYFVACAALTAPETDKEYVDIKNDFANRSLAAGSLISWFPNAILSLRHVDAPSKDALLNQALAAENVLEVLTNLGISGPKFDLKLTEVEELLGETDSSKFERGLVALGTLLGFTSLRPAGDGAPDACWQLENQLCIILEGKSEENPESGISIQNCRQTSMHRDWAASKDYLKNVTETVVCLVSPRTTIDSDALPYGKDVYYISISEIQTLLSRTRQMLTECRPYLVSENNDRLKEIILDTMKRLELTPNQLKTHFLSNEVTSLPQV